MKSETVYSIDFKIITKTKEQVDVFEGQEIKTDSYSCNALYYKRNDAIDAAIAALEKLRDGN